MRRSIAGSTLALSAPPGPSRSRYRSRSMSSCVMVLLLERLQSAGNLFLDSLGLLADDDGDLAGTQPRSEAQRQQLALGGVERAEESAQLGQCFVSEHHHFGSLLVRWVQRLG